MSNELVYKGVIPHTGDESVSIFFQFDEDAPVMIGRMDCNGDFTIAITHKEGSDGIQFVQDAPEKKFRIFTKK